MSEESSRSRQRSWARFSLRTLLLLMVVASVPLGWIGNELMRIRHQRQIIAKVASLEGKCYFDYESEANDHGYSYEMSPKRWLAPQWMRQRLGDDALAYVRLVQFHHPYASRKDADIGFVDQLSRLQALDADGRKVTDSDLEHIAKLRDLRYLRILAPRVTDKGLRFLWASHKLETLEMHDLDVSDKGLECLSLLQSLRSLKITSSRITDEGFVHFGKIATLESLDISAADVTGKGFSYLRNLKQLKGITLSSPKVADEATAHLGHLRNLRILWLSEGLTQEAALRLADLPELRLLILGRDLPAETILKLREALPNCEVMGGPLPSDDEPANTPIQDGNSGSP